MTIGEQIEKRRKAKGMYQEDLAAKLNITKQAICNWEKGRTEPNIGYINQLAKALNCSVSDLLSNTYDGECLTTQNNQEYVFLSEFRNADETTKEMIMRLFTYNKLTEESKNESH